MVSRFHFIRCVLLCVTLVGGLCPCLIFAQTTTTGALTGTVTDQTGAVLPGVDVTITHLAMGTIRSVATDEGGVYRIPLLPAGNYSVQFALVGFKSQTMPDIVVNVTETHTLNVRLEVGELTETVTVDATTRIVQTETVTLGRLVDNQTITSLPLTTRNYTQVIGLGAGVGADVTNAGELGKNSQDVYVNGLRSVDNNYQMDGTNINNFHTGRAGEWLGAGGIAIPNPDTIQEFKIQTALYDAGYGRNAGANVNVVTKSGTNEFHGTLFEFFRNEALNANEFFLNRNSQPKPVLRQNQYGGTFGGPVVKDKLLFFGS